MNTSESRLARFLLALFLVSCVYTPRTPLAWAESLADDLESEEYPAVVSAEDVIVDQDYLETSIDEGAAPAAVSEDALTDDEYLGASEEDAAASASACTENDGETEPGYPASGESSTYDLKADFGAVGDGVADDTKAFNDALRKSRDNSAMTTIVVPSGTYRITSYLFIYSNTTLQLAPDATVIADASFGKGTMLGAVHSHNGAFCDGLKSTCISGGYSQIVNVVIDGGTWDRNVTGNGQASVMRFNHGRNITIRNTTIKRASDHFLNLSGCCDVTISNVTFCDFVYTYILQKFSGRAYQNEAIHFDPMQKETEASAYPQDNTVAYNVRVEGCTFINIPDGVGTHHTQDNIAKSHDITVTDCTFDNLSGRAVNVYKTDNFVVQNCLATNCSAFVVTRDDTCTIQNNRVIGTKLHKDVGSSSDTGEGIKVVDSRGAVVKNNVIVGAFGHGIQACRNSGDTLCRINITGNVSVSMTNIGTYYDIALGYNCVGTVKDNNIGVRGLKHW